MCRWYEYDPQLRTQKVDVVNWALAALVGLCADPQNLERLVGARKPAREVTAVQSSESEKQGFGYSKRIKFGLIKRVDLATDGHHRLAQQTAWSPFGWGSVKDPVGAAHAAAPVSSELDKKVRYPWSGAFFAAFARTCN